VHIVSTDKAPNSGRPSPSIALAVVSLALAIAACGSSGKSSSTTGGSSNFQLALSECMRSHGVPNYPDPTKGPGGEGFSISSSPGSSSLTVDDITFSGPAFQSAEKTCKLFGGGSSPPPISESQKLAAFHFAQCMRKHGVTNYLDPTFPAGGGISRTVVPGLNLQSPAVKQAAPACGIRIP
jgi:hypothetical protein